MKKGEDRMEYAAKVTYDGGLATILKDILHLLWDTILKGSACRPSDGKRRL